MEPQTSDIGWALRQGGLALACLLLIGAVIALWKRNDVDRVAAAGEAKALRAEFLAELKASREAHTAELRAVREEHSQETRLLLEQIRTEHAGRLEEARAFLRAIETHTQAIGQLMGLIRRRATGERISGEDDAWTDGMAVVAQSGRLSSGGR